MMFSSKISNSCIQPQGTNRTPDLHLLLRPLTDRLNNRSFQQPVESGFTLIELLIVVIIIGVLAAIALLSFLNQQGRSRVVSGTCSAAGTASAFTATNAAFGTTTPGVATVAANGSVALTQCAAASGWTAGTAPVCTPTKAS
jgi:prepilin-type N-terminal cleavage/methylation domain-containing protein